MDEAVERDALALVEAALDQPMPAEHVRRHATGPAVRERALALLSRQPSAALRTGDLADLDQSSPPPERVGAYRITGLIGQGGMGAVYRGERATGDFDHQVAIKLVRPGALGDELIERFARERQTLARLAHPTIARLLDGGTTPDGQPYIVMELVDGVPLDRWLATNPPAPARLDLFLAVCDAVGFAHRNLVVHRDLTPPNVLVTPEGAPKLIDFGIARPVGGEAAGDRAQTATPGFAAPERLLPGGAATTSGDIYALGRLLERVFPEPRARDLSAVVAKATAEHPDDRYPTADALAADVQAWRDRRPVAARRGGPGYAFRRFVDRNRLSVGAGAAALVLLLAAFAGTVWALDRARAAQRAEAARFDQVRALARYLLFDLNGRMARVAGNVGARADMAGQAQRYLTILSDAAGRDRPDLRLETAQGLIRLARIQGSPTEPNIGEPAAAERNLAQARTLLADLDATRPAVAAASAEGHALRGQMLANDEMRQDDAGREIALARRIADTVPVGYQARRAVRHAEIELADIANDYALLRALAGKLEADIARWPARLRDGRLAALEGAHARYLRALVESETGERKDYGLPEFLKAETQFDQVIRHDPYDPSALLLMTDLLKNAYAAASRSGAEQTAQRLILKADAISERLIALDDRDEGVRKRAGSIKEGLAQNLRDHDRFDAAIALQQRVLALRRANIGPDRNARRVADLGFSQMILGIIARDAGRRDLACDSWTASARTMTELDGRGQLAGFMKAFVPGLRDKARLCAAGAPLSRLHAPIR